MRDDLNDIHADLERQGKTVTARRILDIYRNPRTHLSLLDLMQAMLKEEKKLVGVELALGTYTGHKSRFKKVAQFLAAHNLSDLHPSEFTYSTADKFLHWLLLDQKFGRNSAVKGVQVVGMVLAWGVRRELLDVNPMQQYKYKLAPPKDIIYLMAEDVAELAAFPLEEPTLQKVRDAFILQCWTGLAYADLLALNVRRDVENYIDQQGVKRRLLRVRRQKSTYVKNYECIIPLLPEAERILTQYNDKVPIFTNQAYNRYLKEIGARLGFSPEQMTTHVGRKTAGVLMLNLGVRMEVVSKYLGHRSVTMTERIYAKILDKTLIEDFGRVFYNATQTPEPAQPQEVGGRVVPLWAEATLVRKEAASA
ncbi:site-specific integrase [Hymenobacter ginkgonis]|nr:site-specific integrase [Hymenobacter ginkgonis]